MKEELIFEGITNIREDIIERAENYEFRKKETKKFGKVAWVKWAALAACVLLVLWSPFIYMSMQKMGSPAPEGWGPVDEVLVVEKDVWIYYVDGDEVEREQQYLPMRASEIFAAWKEKNGIGAEVLLIDYEIRSNSTTDVEEFEGESVAEHVIGEYRSLYLIVSKNLEAYYEKMGEGLLLESLKQTMTGYIGLEIQEYNLSLE